MSETETVVPKAPRDVAAYAKAWRAANRDKIHASYRRRKAGIYTRAYTRPGSRDRFELQTYGAVLSAEDRADMIQFEEWQRLQDERAKRRAERAVKLHTFDLGEGKLLSTMPYITAPSSGYLAFGSFGRKK